MLVSRALHSNSKKSTVLGQGFWPLLTGGWYRAFFVRKASRCERAKLADEGTSSTIHAHARLVCRGGAHRPLHAEGRIDGRNSTRNASVNMVGVQTLASYVQSTLAALGQDLIQISSSVSSKHVSQNTKRLPCGIAPNPRKKYQNH
ncbi:hypothetical protein P171DRAFT_435324, partial [Karstenula rhodostoma CBS 690.94]